MTYTEHKTVLLIETVGAIIEGLAGKANPVVVDLTFGGGGHSFELLKRHPGLRLIAFDKDREAFNNGLKRIQSEGASSRVSLVNSDFINIKERLANDFQLYKVDGILADLGVSSHHFDDQKRGFSYAVEAPLDMRMDTETSPFCAYHVINEYDEDEIVHLLSEYGEEQFAKRIAHNIILERAKAPIETTTQLEAIVFHSYPSNFKKNYRTHPATKTFQAVRIEVNGELKGLESMLPDSIGLLSNGSRLAVISFHSLEDRIVKHYFKKVAAEGGYKLLSKKPIIPSEEELKFNPRSRSAKLRVIERV